MTGVSPILSAVSRDGLNWELEGVRLEVQKKQEGPMLYHPRVIRLPDGGYRIFYRTAENRNWSAISRDGLTWEKRQPENIFGADPDVVTLPDGQLRMYTNALNELAFGPGRERQRMFSYVWCSLHTPFPPG